MFRVLAVLAVVLPAMSVAGEDYVDLVKKGNEAYRQKDYKSALEYYHSAETEIPESLELEYNIAGALHEQGKYEEALDKYTRALNAEDINLEAQAHYNLGNTYVRTGDYQNAIMAYQKALEINPDDLDAKFNLELARKLLKEQIKPEQQQQQDGQQQQQPQPQPDDSAQKEEPEPDQQPNDQNAPQDQQPEQMDDKQVSKEDAERILNALRDDEQEIQKKIKREVKVGEYSGKDW